MKRKPAEPGTDRRFAGTVVLWAVTLLFFIRALVSADSLLLCVVLLVGLVGVVAGGAVLLVAHKRAREP